MLTFLLKCIKLAITNNKGSFIMNKRSLTPALEDYLEAISILIEKNGKATVTGISKALDVRKPSVHNALKRLEIDKYIIHEKYKDVKLTEKGKEKASNVYKKHKVIYRFLKSFLCVDTKTAEEDACKIEHSVSGETLEKLIAFHSFIAKSDFFNSDRWRETFLKFCESGSIEQDKKVH